MVGAAADQTIGACPSCGADVYASDRFCEACGSDLPTTDVEPPPPAAPVARAHPADGLPHDCGGTFAGGWCDTCGARAPDPRDHVEVDLDTAAGVSDRGLRHHRNEDAMAIDRTARAVVGVVADGVSATVDPQHASAATAQTACRHLVDELGDGGDGNATDDDGVATALVGAHAAAVRAVADLTWTPRPELGAPSCTFLAGVVGESGPVWVASLGDCRAYWLADGGAEQLTADDSWAAEQVRDGLLTTAEADADPRAHVITRWVGEDADADWQPTVIRHDAGDRGRLVLCTDGLWNHLDDVAQLAALVDAAATPLEVAATLVDFANDAGGHDNVTVVVIDRNPTDAAIEEPS